MEEVEVQLHLEMPELLVVLYEGGNGTDVLVELLGVPLKALRQFVDALEQLVAALHTLLFGLDDCIQYLLGLDYLLFHSLRLMRVKRLLADLLLKRRLLVLQ